MKTLHHIVVAFAASILASGCATELRIPGDNQWHSIAAIQVVDRNDQEIRKRLLVTSQLATDIPACAGVANSGLFVRIVRIPRFGDYTTLPEPAAGAPPPVTTEDSGPLDMGLVGAWRMLTVGTGTELIVRSKSPCAVARVVNLY